MLTSLIFEQVFAILIFRESCVQGILVINIRWLCCMKLSLIHELQGFKAGFFFCFVVENHFIPHICTLILM